MSQESLEAFETLLLDGQAAILRSLLEVLPARNASAHVRPIVLLASGRGCGLALVRHAVNHMLESAVARGPSGMADLLEWWCDAELQADAAVSRGVIAMEAVASYVKAHINSALQATLERAMREVVHIRAAHSAAASPAVSSTASSRPTSRPTSPEGSISTEAGTLNADVSSQLQLVITKAARELLSELLPPMDRAFGATYAPPLRRLFYEVASLFEEFRPGAGPQGLTGLLMRGVLPALLEPLEYGIAMQHGISAHAVAEDALRSARVLASDMQGCVQLYYAAQRELSEALDVARLGRRHSTPASDLAATPTPHTLSPRVAASPGTEAARGDAAGDAAEKAAAGVAAGAASPPPPAGSISAWCAQVLQEPVPDGPCISMWEQQRVTQRSGWQRLWPMSLDTIRQSVLAHFSRLSPQLVGEVATEVFTHSTVDRFQIVMPLLEREYVPDFSSSAPQSPESLG